MPDLLELPRLPDLSARFELCSDFHVYVVKCKCAAQTIITIIGDGMGPACPACGEQPVAKVDGPVKLGRVRPGLVQ